MPRVLPGAATRRRHKRMLRKASGYWGSRSKLFRFAKQVVTKAGQYSFRDRRVKKRDFRALWIVRLSAACEAVIPRRWPRSSPASGSACGG